MFRYPQKKWDEKLADEIGIDLEKLPEIYPCPEVIGEVTSAAAKETGLAAGTPVVAGTVDANAAWLAMGMVENGDNSVVMGTAGVLGVCHEKPEFTKNMITIVHTANCEKTYTTLMALVSCGALIRYFRDNLGQLEMDTAAKIGISEYDVLNLEAEKAPPGSDGLIVLPYFMGERTPIWDPLARGVLFGLSIAHTRGHIIRALMEGAGYGMLHNLELIRKSGLYIKPVLTMGEGGAHSRLWRQIISDILNVKGAYMAECPGAPLGNAINAGVGVGVADPAVPVGDGNAGGDAFFDEALDFVLRHVGQDFLTLCLRHVAGEYGRDRPPFSLSAVVEVGEQHPDVFGGHLGVPVRVGAYFVGGVGGGF